MEKLKVIGVCKIKENSYISTGIAWDWYGDGVVKKTKKYSDYKYRSKFVKFVDKWYKMIYDN